MKKIVLSNPNEFRLEISPPPGIEADELLIKVAYCAICATDIRILEGKKTKGVSYPRVVGHEISGTIYEVGNQVTLFRPGDRVSVAPIIACGHCRNCLCGRENLCLNRSTIGYDIDGGFAGYIRIPAVAATKKNIFVIPRHLSFKEAALIEPLACCLNGNNKADIGQGDHVLIVGAGTIGQFHVLLSKLRGANFVVVSDLLEYRRAKALTTGADRAINPAVENILDVAQKNGVDGFNKIIFACAATSEINNLVNCCAKGGTVVLFSGFPDRGLGNIDLNALHYKEIQLAGSSGYTQKNYADAFSLVSDGKIDVKPFISAVYTIDDFVDAYQKQKSGSEFKILIKS